MPLPVPTTIASGFDDAGGSAYRKTAKELLITDAGAGTISAVNIDTRAPPTVLGTGYNSPHDIALSVDGLSMSLISLTYTAPCLRSA